LAFDLFASKHETYVTTILYISFTITSFPAAPLERRVGRTAHAKRPRSSAPEEHAAVRA